jgi:hypothetical protein
VLFTGIAIFPSTNHSTGNSEQVLISRFHPIHSGRRSGIELLSAVSVAVFHIVSTYP